MTKNIVPLRPTKHLYQKDLISSLRVIVDLPLLRETNTVRQTKLRDKEICPKLENKRYDHKEN